MNDENDNQNIEITESESTENKDDFSFEEIADEESSGVDLRGKLSKLRSELKVCNDEKAEYLNGWQRSRADFVNLKKTFEKEKIDMVKYGNELIMRDLLNALDSFEVAFSNKDLWESVDVVWRQGVENLHSQIIKALEKHGLSVIDAIGQPFDATCHQAIGSETVEDKTQDGIVTKVFQKGYKLGDRILRPARVIVGQAKE